MKTLPEPSAGDCRHHWLLGQPRDGLIEAVCRLCGGKREYPAVLDDLDPGVESDPRPILSAATAAGGARPSSSALLVDLES